MATENCSNMLEEHGIRPTPNRVLVAQALCHAARPLSMSELENTIGSIDKSNIFRTLTTFRQHGLVHAIEDGDGVRYEICHSHDCESDDDLHAHFFCEVCRKTYCITSTELPQPTIPQGYKVNSLNYILKGVCPACNKG
ncbi:MAG: transcriptional repressor [Bacteroidales bacterium]|nr:transcriptional repressor [Bacteroidales bacterium]